MDFCYFNEAHSFSPRPSPFWLPFSIATQHDLGPWRSIFDRKKSGVNGCGGGLTVRCIFNSTKLDALRGSMGTPPDVRDAGFFLEGKGDMEGWGIETLLPHEKEHIPWK